MILGCLRKNKTVKKMTDVIMQSLATVSPIAATELLFYDRFGYFPNFIRPKTLNEKILWLKLFYYKDQELVRDCIDKYKVREYVTEKGHADILNDLLFVWNSPRDIDWTVLPNKFVIKCNHGYAYNIICKDKSIFDVEDSMRRIEKWYKEEFWKRKAEINYKGIKKKIICEKYMEDKMASSLVDYKVYCFNGVANYILTCVEKEGIRKFIFYDREWNIQPISDDSIEMDSRFIVRKPHRLFEMLDIAENLAYGFPFVRVDFFIVAEEVKFGEMTFTPAAGLDNRRWKTTDILLGDLVKLPSRIK